MSSFLFVISVLNLKLITATIQYFAGGLSNDSHILMIKNTESQRMLMGHGHHGPPFSEGHARFIDLDKIVISQWGDSTNQYASLLIMMHFMIYAYTRS